MRTSKLWLFAAFASLAIGVKAQTIDPNNVQVHHQYTNILADCKRLGPLNKSYRPRFLDSYLRTISSAAIKMAQEDVAKMGGDTLVIVRMTPDVFGVQVELQSIVMRCFESVKNPEQEKIISELTRKSLLGEAEAMVNLAYMYLNGNGVQKSVNKAFELYSAAAKMGNKNSIMAINAQLNLGHIWEFGLLGERNFETALMWYLLAGSTKNDESERRISNIKRKMNDVQIQNGSRMMKICMVNDTENCGPNSYTDSKVCEVVKIEGANRANWSDFDKSKVGIVLNPIFQSNTVKLSLIEGNKFFKHDFEVDEKSNTLETNEYIKYVSKVGWGDIRVHRTNGDIILNFGKSDVEKMTVSAKCQ